MTGTHTTGVGVVQFSSHLVSDSEYQRRGQQRNDRGTWSKRGHRSTQLTSSEQAVVATV